jgi:hypothetical protein
MVCGLGRGNGCCCRNRLDVEPQNIDNGSSSAFCDAAQYGARAGFVRHCYYLPRHNPTLRARLPACAIAVIVLLFGLLTLGEYILSWNLGIDSILIGPAAMPSRLYPGRPSPQAAANFALLGIALLIYNSRRSPIRIGQACALLVGGNAIVALTGYIFSTREFHGFPSITTDIGMAVHTAASFILLALALLCSRPGDGIMSLVVSDTRSGQMARRILWVGIVAPPLVGER